MDSIFKFFILLLSFLLGIVSINKPEIVFRSIAMWFRLVSGGNAFDNEKAKKALQYINDPEQYHKEFPEAIAIIQRTGYVALFVAIAGLCIVLVAK